MKRESDLSVPPVPRYFIILPRPPQYPNQPQDQYKPQLTNWRECMDGLTEGVLETG